MSSNLIVLVFIFSVIYLDVPEHHYVADVPRGDYPLVMVLLAESVIFDQHGRAFARINEDEFPT